MALSAILSQRANTSKKYRSVIMNDTFIHSLAVNA